MATTALETRVDYRKIIFVLHVGVLYRIINYTQKSGCAGQAEEAADLIILIKKSLTQQKTVSKQIVNKKIITLFIKIEKCQ